ncbi:DUF177 domain-containing protein [Desulfovibrio sp. Huiquan2017]|uniref:YceD family protein n=1 Tax=Desulfovibrio sp. Huiquan2017 TaxID=2816861 RepID=UPI001A92F462|nr:DUF177 domain-containing protein [Desulfovibrio sp. Huiquan2017]
MVEFWLTISDVAAEGKDFTFDDQTFWRDAWRAFKLGVRPGRDLVAEFTVLPQSEDGALVRGTLAGSVQLVCDRCAEPFEYSIDTSFDAFEQLPDGEESEGEPRVRVENGQLQLDMGSILWEEFALALPFKPLCSEECGGICPGCGANLNTGECTCKPEEGDERLAVFRDLKIK